jgi:protein SCO1
MTDKKDDQNQVTTSTLTRYWVYGAVAAVVVAGSIFAGVVAANMTSGGGSASGSNDDIPHFEPGRDQPAFLAPQITPAWPKPDFVLTDTAGNPYDIQAETEGYVTVLALGYTHCPDECPLHMFNISQALSAMDTEDAERVKVLFITTDPERDTGEVIRRWLDNFNADFVGLTGSEEEIIAVQRELGVRPAEVGLEEGDEYFLIHSAVVYAFDKDTNLSHIAFPHTPDGSLARDEWAHDLTKLVREGWQEN